MYPNQAPYGNQYPGSAPPFGAGQQPYPGQQSYPQQPGYPPQQPGYPPQQPGFAPQQPQMPGYLPQQPGFPPQQPQMPGYPPQQPGFPPQQPQMPGYPSQIPAQPPQQPFGSGFQPQMPQPPNYQTPGMPQQQPFNYQSPPMTQPGFPSQPPAAYPPAQQGFQSQAYPQANQPATYPGLAQEIIQQPVHQSQSFAAAPAAPLQNQPYGAMPQQVPYGQPNYGSPQQQAQKGRPTLLPAQNFNASNDAGVLRKAMKGFGTDEDAIIEVLCRRTNAQRIEIVRTYKVAYGKDLLDDIRSESSGNFQRTLVALLTPTHEFYARELYEAMYGEGTDEDVLIEVMCALSNYEIRCIGAMFQRMFGKNLEKELQSDTSGSFKRLMTSLACASRDESMITDVNQAKADAQELKTAGIDKWGTDESAFNRILCLRNFEQIKLIAREYQSLTGHPLERDIKKEFSGDIEDGLLAILRVAENRAEFFARRLHKSMAGIGTDDKALIRLVVGRCEIDMMDIKEEFTRKYGKTLKSFIKGDTSGHYKHALYALIGENRS